MSVAHGRRAAVALAAVALGAGAVALPGCGVARPATVYRNADYAFTLAYDGGRFTPGQLADTALIDAVHAAGDATPVFSVSFVDRARPSAAGTFPDGFRVSVFDFPQEGQSLGLWRLGDQVIPPLVTKMRQALPPGSTISDPVQASFRGMQGYAASYSVASYGETYSGWVVGWAEGDFIYEIIAQGSAADFDSLRPAFADLLFWFRAGPDASVDLP